ncbi:MAG: MnhB domain-containing protein [Litorivicinus sp.]
MNSLVLSTITRILAPLLLVFSVFILLRGHNDPGGGFIGGLIAAIAFILISKAEGRRQAMVALRVRPLSIAGTGLLMAIVAGFWGLIAKGAFLKGIWPLIVYNADGSKGGLPIGSILLFDLGVFLVVIGGVCGIFFNLEKAVGEDTD